MTVTSILPTIAAFYKYTFEIEGAYHYWCGPTGLSMIADIVGEEYTAKRKVAAISV